MPGTHHKMPFSRKKCLQYGGAGHNGYNVSSIPPDACVLLISVITYIHSSPSLLTFGFHHGGELGSSLYTDRMFFTMMLKCNGESR